MSNKLKEIYIKKMHTSTPDIYNIFVQKHIETTEHVKK